MKILVKKNILEKKTLIIFRSNHIDTNKNL